MAKHVKMITPLNSPPARDQNPTQYPVMESPRLESSDNYSQKQSLTVLGLAVAFSSFGAICTSPRMAQAAPTNLPLANSHSSILITQSTPQNDQVITGNSKLETDQEQIVKNSTIEIRSNTKLGTGSVKTISVPKLPSLTLAQNIQSKTITKQIYTVRPGDTINSIARLYGISTDKIIEANKIKNPNRLSVNDQLVIPLEKSQTNKELNFVSSNPKFVPFSVTNPISARRSSNTMAQVVTRDISSNISTSQENLRDPYISRLRADIDELRNQFQDWSSVSGSSR